MTHTIINIYDNILKYNDTEIMVLFDDNDEPWFSSLQIAKMLEYERPKKAIQEKIEKKYKKKLIELIDDPKELGHNIQPHTVFINEAGLYSLISKSSQNIAKEFKMWLFEEVLPQIRKTGKYAIVDKYKKQYEEINKKMQEIADRNKVLENNQRKEKYPKGGLIYVVRPPEGDIELLKIGRTENLPPRKNTYNSSVPDNMEILYILKVDNPIAVEHCLKSLLYDHRYRNNKEFYKCTLDFITNIIIKCDKIVKGEYYCENCEKNIEKNELSRHIAIENDIDQNMETIYGLYMDIDEFYQEGGGIDEKYVNEYKYFKYKMKYLGLLVQIEEQKLKPKIF